MPSVADPNAQSNSMGQGVASLGQGLGQAFRNGREEAWKQQQQQNWRDQFAFQQAQQIQNQNNWNKQFAQTKKMQDAQLEQLQAQLERQQEQDEWLKQFYDAYFGNDEEYKELQQLRNRFAGSKAGVSDNALTLMGINPLFMR